MAKGKKHYQPATKLKHQPRRTPHNLPPFRQPVVVAVPIINNNPVPRAPKPRKDPPYYRQAPEEEDNIKDMINADDFCKRYLLGPIVNAYLILKQKISNTRDYDLQELLAILQKEIQRDKHFLPNPIATSQIKKLIAARNEVDHNNWAAVQLHCVSHLNSMIALATSLGDIAVANQIQAVLNRILVKDFTGGVSFRPFTFSATGYDPMAALGLSQITARIINKYMVTATWSFLHSNLPAGANPPSMDLYANVIEMNDKLQANPNYLPNGASAILHSIKVTRLDVAHGHHEDIFHDFEVKLDDFTKYLRLIGHPEEADAVGVVRDTLVALKKSGEQVTSAHLPSLF